MARSYRNARTARGGKRHSRGRLRLLVGLLLATPGGSALATGTGVDALGFEYENDLFAGVDRYYTSGVRATWTRSGEHVPDWLQDIARQLPMFPAAGSQGRLKYGASLGQNMYTPEDIEQDPPDPADRPYAGWLYLNFNLAQDRQNRLDRLQVTLGVVGPASLADRTQKAVHDLIGSPRPRGWGSQISNQPTLMLAYERQLRRHSHLAQRGWDWDLTPHWGVTVGSPFTFANAGTFLRVGRHLPRDYGPPRINPALSGSHTFEATRPRGGYLFAGLDTRVIAYDLFLDGPLLRAGPSVDKHPLVGELTAGVVFHTGALRIGYTHVWRSREFSGQVKGAAEFGALHATWQF